MPTFSVLHEDSLTFGPAQRAGPPFCAHWGLNPGPSACRADVMPLHHMPTQRMGTRQGPLATPIDSPALSVSPCELRECLDGPMDKHFWGHVP